MLYCLNCGHAWIPRSETPRQCPKCWSTLFVKEEDLKLASLWARFLANWQRGMGPLEALLDAIAALMPTLSHEYIIPLPRVLPSLWAWNDVMTQCKTKEMRVRAISKMLEMAGFPPEHASCLAESLAGAER